MTFTRNYSTAEETTWKQLGSYLEAIIIITLWSSQSEMAFLEVGNGLDNCCMT